MVVLEAVGRLVPGVMGNDESAERRVFADGLLEYPQYTKPASFRGWAVPEVLRSGDHGRVDRWRRAQALRATSGPARPDRGPGRAERRRPTLLDEFPDAERSGRALPVRVAPLSCVSPPNDRA